MLDKFREGAQGTAAKIVLGIVILSFALAGVGSYLGRPANTEVAVVNGDNISRQEFEQSYQKERARLEAQLGERFDLMAENPAALAQIRKGVLERMVNERLLDQQADTMGLRISDAQIKATIRQMPEFQVNGKFDNERYLALLRQAGYMPEQFGELLRRDMARQQLLSGLQDSEFSLAGEQQMIAALLQQQRDIRYARIAADAFADKVSVGEDELHSFYEQHPEQFRSEEQIKLSYVQLDAAQLADSIEVDEDQIEQYYREHARSYTTPERRRASHILIAFGDDKAGAKAKAQSLLAQLRNGADFPELAKTESDDGFSARKGGDLDWFTQGVMDPAFDAAVFELQQPGDLSSVVESSFGFHIIKLTGLEAAVLAPLEQVREQIAATVKKNMAIDQFYGLQQTLAEVSFEVPDTLEDAAKAVGAQVRQTGWFGRSDVPQELSDPKVLQVAFAAQNIAERLNSELITLEQNRVVVLRVTDHREPSTLPFTQVQDTIRQRLIQQQASAKAMELQLTVAAAMSAGEPVKEMLAEVGSKLVKVNKLTRDDLEIPPAIIQRVFAIAKPEGSSPVVEAVDLNNGDKAVVQLLAVHEPADASLADSDVARFETILAQAQLQAVIAKLRADADISYPYDVSNP